MIQRPPHEVAVVSGIGCSSRIPAYTTCYGFHGVHGRALAAGTGLKVARPDLTVVVTGGDGDGYSIGGNHFMHACRRNVDMTYIVMDNHVYGMTKGQASPTTEPDWDNKLSPGGTGIRAFHPLVIALASGANFVARGFSGDPNGTAAIIAQAIRHPGFSFVEILSPCVTFRPEQKEWKEIVRAAPGGAHRRPGTGRAPHHDRRRLQHRRALCRPPQPLPGAGGIGRAQRGRPGTGVRAVKTTPQTLDEFMAVALAMENEAVDRYTDFADMMETHNNGDVAAMFRTMAGYEAKHAQHIMDADGLEDRARGAA